MRFRPANISLINRRHYLPRLLLTLSSNEKKDQRTLTGHYISISGLATTRPKPRIWLLIESYVGYFYPSPLKDFEQPRPAPVS
jgi:hypothetical protein